VIRSSVTVSLVPEARGGPFVFWDDLPAACRKAKELGFDAIEVFPPSPQAPELKPLPALLSDNGLALAAMGTGAGWVKHRLTLTVPDATMRRLAHDFIRGVIDAAAICQAPAIIGSMQGRWGDGSDKATAFGWLAEGVNALGDYALQHGVPLLFEPLNRYETNLVNTVDSGLELIKLLSSRNVRLLCDLFHMNIEEVDIAAALRSGGDWVGHVHFVDSNRRPAGCGHLDYAPIAKALTDTGFRGYASAEALPYPNPDAAAQQTIAAFRRWFRG
jgi:sugar phosphate isomerase/epimerase